MGRVLCGVPPGGVSCLLKDLPKCNVIFKLSLLNLYILTDDCGFPDTWEPQVVTAHLIL